MMMRVFEKLKIKVVHEIVLAMLDYNLVLVFPLLSILRQSTNHAIAFFLNNAPRLDEG